MTNATSSPLSISKEAWLSLGFFFILLLAVFATREDKVSEGIKVMTIEKPSKEKVTSIELSGKHKAIVTKDGEKWVVADPENPALKYPVGEAAINNALDSMDTLEAGSFVTGRTDKHAELEIDEEKGHNVKIVQADGRTLHLVFGRFGKGGGNYMRFDGSDEVFVGKGRLAGALRKDVRGWREKKLFYDSPDELKTVDVLQPGKTTISLVTYEEAEGEETKTKYKLKEGTPLPPGFRLDEVSLRRLASSITALNAVDFGAAGDDTGITAESPSVVVQTKAGKKIVLQFGKANEKEQFFASSSDSKQIFLLAKNTVERILVDIDYFRDMKFATLDANQVIRASFNGSKSQIEVQKDETSGSWTLVSSSTPPEGFEFDPSALPKISQIGGLRATKYLGSTPFGAGKPRVDLFFADGTQKSLIFGGQVPKADEKDPELHYARGLIDGATYAVPKYAKDRYDDPINLFKKAQARAAPPGGPGGPGGMGGAPQGMENLPPEIREQLMKQMQQQGGMPQR